VTLKLGQSLIHGSVVRLEEPLVAADEGSQAYALVRGDGDVPAGTPFAQAFAVWHQDVLPRGVMAFEEMRENVRLHSAGETELLGTAAMPTRVDNALALALCVVVTPREFAAVVVARLACRE
jgi:hypothetical protein